MKVLKKNENLKSCVLRNVLICYSLKNPPLLFAELYLQGEKLTSINQYFFHVRFALLKFIQVHFLKELSAF